MTSRFAVSPHVDESSCYFYEVRSKRTDAIMFWEKQEKVRQNTS